MHSYVHTLSCTQPWEQILQAPKNTPTDAFWCLLGCLQIAFDMQA